MHRLAFSLRRVLCAVVFLILAIPSGHANEAPPPLEAFFKEPATSHFTVSPDGKHIASVLRRPSEKKKGKDEQLIIVQRNKPGKPEVTAVNGVGDWDVSSLTWLTDERLLIVIQQLPKGDIWERYNRRRGQRFRWGRYFYPRFITMNADGSDITMLLDDGFSLRNAYSVIIRSLLPKDPDHILMEVMPQTTVVAPRYSAYKVNIYNGKADRVMKGNRNVTDLWPDQDGEIRLKRVARNKERTYLVRKKGSHTWTELLKVKGAWVDFTILDFAADPNILYVRSRRNQKGGRSAIFEYDLTKMALGRKVYGHDQVDVENLIFHFYTNETAGVEFDLDRTEFVYFDETFKKLQRKMERTFGTKNTSRILSYSRDQRYFVIGISGPREQGEFLMFDSKTNEARALGRINNELDLNTLGGMRAVSYKSRDGYTIHGYLTTPPGHKDGEVPPLVVMPHGGPAARDYLAYDPWVQVLATRGYAVFQPNYRGSDGYGAAFTRIGDKQHGRKIQNDITDGVRFLVGEGLADAGRVCIVGASYGGYAALAGAAFTPELYQCAVSINGVSDLQKMIEYDVRNSGRGFGRNSTREYFYKVYGDPSDDDIETLMKATSPRHHADKIKAPVLLIHGRGDETVPIEQSEYMAKALRRADKPHEFVKLKADHSLSTAKLQVEAFSEILAFLGKHLPAE